MKKLRKRIISSVNVLLASMITALGVVGCSHQKSVAKHQKSAVDEDEQAVAEDSKVSKNREEMVCMYGVPRAQYNIQGVVETPSGKPLAVKEITIKISGDEYYVETDESGTFSLNVDGFPAEEFVVEIDGKQYEESVTYDGEPKDAWDRGPATMKVQIIHPVEQVSRPIERPILVKYGVPPTRMEK